MHAILEEELFAHAHIQLNLGKTQVWNRGGVVPTGVAELTASARQVMEDATVWRGDPELRSEQQGVKVLGTPIGQPEFVQEFLAKKSREPLTLFERIPKWKTSSPVGCCCWRAAPREQIVDSATRLGKSHSQRGTMPEYGNVCSISSASQTLLQRLRPSLSCHSDWVGFGLASVVRGRAAAHGQVGVIASGW